MKSLIRDAKNIRDRDPAAKSLIEVMLLYPGFHVLIYYRIAHWLYNHKRFFLARWVSQRGRKRTGIEIHPGAKIGEKLFIDHGMGIVIGETAEIGNNVSIYHQVTLGGTGKDKGKRHPTVGDNVLIGAGARILGPVMIGNNSRVAAGSIILKDIPPDSTVAGIPANVVKIHNERIRPSEDLIQQEIPDVLAEEIRQIRSRLTVLEEDI